MKKSTILCAVLSGFLAGSAARAGEPGARGFSVDFSQCTEFAGVGPGSSKSFQPGPARFHHGSVLR